MDTKESILSPVGEDSCHVQFCTNCGLPLQSQDQFCVNCGASVSPGLSQNKHTQKKGLMVACIALGISALIGAMLIFGIPFIKYCQAINMAKHGKYTEAIVAFENMEGYLKSEDYIAESNYLLARKMLDVGDYPAAMEIVTALDSYEDYREQVLECRYNIAMQQKDAGEYLQAAETFSALGEYKDSQTQVVDCRYLYACKLMAGREYWSALEVFEALKGYKDSAENILECKYLQACRLMTETDYQNALELLEPLRDYKDSAEKILECKYQIVLLMIHNGQIVDAYNLLAELGEYKNCTALLISVERIYQRIMAKSRLFVTGSWTEQYGSRVWLSTKVIDDNTLEISIFGSSGAGDQSSEELVGIWDEATGTVKFSGRAFRTIMGSTYCEDDNLTGCIYFENGYLHIEYDDRSSSYNILFYR